MNKEHKRLLKIAQDLKDDAVIKASDSILVIVSNKEGIWTMNGNLGNNENALSMLENICKEMRESLMKTNKQQNN